MVRSATDAVDAKGEQRAAGRRPVALRLSAIDAMDRRRHDPRTPHASRVEAELLHEDAACEPCGEPKLLVDEARRR